MLAGSNLLLGVSGSIAAYQAALAVTAPIVVAPAMHERMWRHAAVQDNVAHLKARGVCFKVQPRSRQFRRSLMAGWQVLARDDHGVGVSRCPEGHIHLELERGTFTLRFDDPQFLAFARTVTAAAKVIGGRRWMNALLGSSDENLSRN